MNINEILSAPNVLELLRERATPQPPISLYTKLLTSDGHDIMSIASRPNKTVTEITTNDDGTQEVNSRSVNVARLPQNYQKLIVDRRTQFVFANPIKLSIDTEDATETDYFNLVSKLWAKAKIDSAIYNMAKEVNGYTEVALKISAIPKQYQFNGKIYNEAIKCTLWKPLDNIFYPLFDNSGDMIAFSREFIAGENTYFETYTAEKIITWINDELVETLANPLGKIPIIYHAIDKPVYWDVKELIRRLEFFLSNFGDSNDYHAFPKLKTKGKINSIMQKGETGGVLELSDDGDANYITYPDAINSIKYEIETLRKSILDLTQVPDLSLDSMVKLGGVSGAALSNMFIDPYLKACDDINSGWDDTVNRVLSIVMEYAAKIDISFAQYPNTTDLKAIITPFKPLDLKYQVETLVLATGNKQIMSTDMAIQLLNVGNYETEINKINEETVQSLGESFV